MKAHALTTLLLAALAAAIMATEARAERTVSIEPDTVLVHPTDLFTLDVAVNGDFDNLMGYNVTVRFDAAYLEAMEVTEGALLAASGFETFFRWLNGGCACDSIRVNGSILGATVAGPGAIGRIKLKALRAGVTYVEIARSDIRDGDNGKLSHVTKRAKVIIEPPIAAGRSSWSQIKRFYR